TDRDGRRGRSRSPACGIPAQGGCLQSREQPQRRLQSPAAEGTARHPETLLERGTVVAVLLRLKLWWSADFHRAPVHRAAADATLTAQRTPTASALSFTRLKAEACPAPAQTLLASHHTSERRQARSGARSRPPIASTPRAAPMPGPALRRVSLRRSAASQKYPF